MKSMMLAAIGSLAAAAAVPAQAQSWASSSFGSGAAAPTVQSGSGVRIHRGDGDRDRRHHRHGRPGDTVIIGGWYGGEWALYNNRSWESDSYNDWWHDQTWRSFPRWTQRGDCSRQWYAADTLRC